METAPRNCRFLSLVVVERVLILPACNETPDGKFGGSDCIDKVTFSLSSERKELGFNTFIIKRTRVQNSAFPLFFSRGIIPASKPCQCVTDVLCNWETNSKTIENVCNHFGPHSGDAIVPGTASFSRIGAEKTMTATDVTGFDAIFSTGFFATFSRF